MFLFILAICKGFCLNLCFLRYCVNAALYTQPVGINSAGHCQYITSAVSGYNLSERGRHSIKPNELTSRVITTQSVTLNSSPKCCKSQNVISTSKCGEFVSRLDRPKSNDTWIELLQGEQTTSVRL